MHILFYFYVYQHLRPRLSTLQVVAMTVEILYEMVAKTDPLQCESNAAASRAHHQETAVDITLEIKAFGVDIIYNLLRFQLQSFVL